MATINGFLLILCLLLLSCKSMSESDEERQIHETIYKTIQAISKNDYSDVMNLIGADYLKDDTFQIRRNVLRVYYILHKYNNGKIDNIKWTTGGQLNRLSQFKYIVPLFNGFDSLTGIKSVVLNLYVGPPEIVPLNQLSGFECDFKVDSEYRGELLEAVKLKDIQDIVDSMFLKK